jgi:hypothetical protein
MSEASAQDSFVPPALGSGVPVRPQDRPDRRTGLFVVKIGALAVGGLMLADLIACSYGRCYVL